MPFFLQSSTLRAVLQLLAVQSEYANLTAPHDHDPDPLSHLKDAQPHSPLAPPPLTQIPVNTPAEYKDLGHTSSGQASEHLGPHNRPLTDVVSSEAIAQRESYVEPAMTSGSSILGEISVVPLVTERVSEKEKPIFEKIISPVINVSPSPALITVKSPINPAVSPAQITPAVDNSSSSITSTDPYCPPPAESLLGLDNSFPEITHSLAGETPLPEPQLAVSTGSPYIKIINCLFHIYIYINPPYGVLHAPSTVLRALAYSNSQRFNQ